MNYKLFQKPPRYFSRARVIISVLETISFEKVLEIGYGDGYVISELVPKENTKKYAFEVSASAKAAVSEVFRQSQITDLDRVSDGEDFDLVMCFETIGYFANPVEFVNLAKGSLKPNGLLLISATLKRGRNIEEQATSYRVFCLGELEECLTNNSFEVMRTINYGGPLIIFFHLIRRIRKLFRQGNSSVVEDSWKDLFVFLPTNLIYTPINLLSVPIEKITSKFFSCYSGVIILARKRDK